MKKLGKATIVAFVSALLVTTTALALFFVNGDFESGVWGADWTREHRIFAGGWDTNGFPVLSAGGSDLSAIVGGPAVAALSISDINTGNVVKYPAVGHYSARVNSQDSWRDPTTYPAGYASNADSLYQTTVVDASDVDATDNMVHLRTMYAAVMVDPEDSSHGTATDPHMPMFFLEVKDETTDTVLYHKASYVGEPGVPWQVGPAQGTAGSGAAYSGTWKFLDWTLVDVIAGAGTGPDSIVGHTLSVTVVATGCEPDGHPGYVYVDEIGSKHAGTVTVVASGPATILSGSPITYTYNYFNGDVNTANPHIVITEPVGVTFTSTGLPAGCGLAGGVVTCDFSGIGAGTGGSLQVQGTVTAAGGSIISHGNYTIGATGLLTLGGPTVTTNVTANTVPVANNDAYSVYMSETLTATSVLVNDTDADSDPLTAAVVSTPSHAATFTFNANGTFTYRPVNGYRGTDTFTYKVNDGTVDSNIATVTITVSPHVLNLRSGAAPGTTGWVRESSENSGKGARVYTTFGALRVGDVGLNQQYRSFIHYSATEMKKLPANAVIIKVTLNLTLWDKTGSPFTQHGRLWADINKGYFGTSKLESTDFQAKATKQNAGMFTTTNGINYQLVVNKADLNRAGVTQFRLRFGVDDDNDKLDDFVRFIGYGANRSLLTITYYVPAP